MTSREVLEQDITQGVDEEVAYNLTTTPWGSSPTGVVITVWDITHNNRDNVTSTVTSGSPSVTGDIITLPVILDLEEDHVYRVEVKFTAGGQVLEPYFFIYGQL